jgi:hypothetical protein
MNTELWKQLARDARSTPPRFFAVSFLAAGIYLGAGYAFVGIANDLIDLAGVPESGEAWLLFLAYSLTFPTFLRVTTDLLLVIEGVDP